MQTGLAHIAEVKGSRRPPGWRGWFLVAPMLLWLVAFVVVPTGILAFYSFGERGEEAPVEMNFTTENYQRIVEGTEISPLVWLGLKSLLVASVAIALRYIPGSDRNHPLWSKRAVTFGWICFFAGLAAFIASPFFSPPDSADSDGAPAAAGGTLVALGIGALAAALAIAIRYAEGASMSPSGGTRGVWKFGWQSFAMCVVGLICFYFEDIFNGVYVQIFVRSVGYAGLTTILCIAIGYPVAYYIGRAPERRRNLLLLLVMIPFWTSFLIRTYAWLRILAEAGLLNGLLLYTKVLSEPLDILYTRNAVLIGLIYSYLPFMILPIYGSVEKLDNALIEAAFDLGAGPVRAFQKVIIPLTKPGIIAGILLVFVPAIGMFAITDLMGGKTVPMIGNVIQNQFGQARDWPFGSALGITLLALFGIALWIATRKSDDSSVMG